MKNRHFCLTMRTSEMFVHAIKTLLYGTGKRANRSECGVIDYVFRIPRGPNVAVSGKILRLQYNGRRTVTRSTNNAGERIHDNKVSSVLMRRIYRINVRFLTCEAILCQLCRNIFAGWSRCSHVSKAAWRVFIIFNDIYAICNVIYLNKGYIAFYVL